MDRISEYSLIDLQKEMDDSKKEFENMHLDYYKDFDYQNFTTYMSHVEHYIKLYGYMSFVYEYVTEERLDRLRLCEALYTVAFTEYFCNKYSLKEPDSIKKYKDKKMDKILYHQGVMVMCNVGLFDGAIKAYKNAIPEFMKHNLAFDIIGEKLGYHENPYVYNEDGSVVKCTIEW